MTIQMTLGNLISKLEALPGDLIFPNGFGKARSWRGAYDEIAFEPQANTTSGEMLYHAKTANGSMYEGYKGGNYTMDLQTPVNIAEWGHYNGDEDYLSEECWDRMLYQAQGNTKIRNETLKELLQALADHFAKEGVGMGIASQVGNDEAKAVCSENLRTARTAFQVALDTILPDGGVS